MIARELFEKKRCDGCGKKGGAHGKKCPALQSTLHAADLVSRAARDAHKRGTLSQILGFGKDMLHKMTSGDVNANDVKPGAHQRWLDDHGKDYGEFASHFVAPRQSVFRLGSEPPKGSEQFGAHVNARLMASPSGDGETPGEKTGENTAA